MTVSFKGHRNLAKSLVATAPSPAATGTSLSVTPGDGALFPSSGSFVVALTPAGQSATSSNTEIALVTARSSDTFTIQRAYEGPAPAQAVTVGWQIANVVTAGMLADLESAITSNSGSVPASVATQTTVGSFGIVIGSAAYPANDTGVQAAFTDAQAFLNAQGFSIPILVPQPVTLTQPLPIFSGLILKSAMGQWAQESGGKIKVSNSTTDVFAWPSAPAYSASTDYTAGQFVNLHGYPFKCVTANGPSTSIVSPVVLNVGASAQSPVNAIVGGVTYWSPSPTIKNVEIDGIAFVGNTVSRYTNWIAPQQSNATGFIPTDWKLTNCDWNNLACVLSGACTRVTIDGQWRMDNVGPHDWFNGLPWDASTAYANGTVVWYQNSHGQGFNFKAQASPAAGTTPTFDSNGLPTDSTNWIANSTVWVGMNIAGADNFVVGDGYGNNGGIPAQYPVTSAALGNYVPTAFVRFASKHTPWRGVYLTPNPGIGMWIDGQIDASLIEPSARCNGIVGSNIQTADWSSATAYSRFAQVTRNKTTIHADSNGGDTATITTWSAPAAGQLAVASTAQAGTSGQALVTTSTGTATIAYTGVGTDGSGNPCLTGCTLVNGKGTVSTGATVRFGPSYTALVANTNVDPSTDVAGNWAQVSTLPGGSLGTAGSSLYFNKTTGQIQAGPVCWYYGQAPFAKANAAISVVDSSNIEIMDGTQFANGSGPLVNIQSASTAIDQIRLGHLLLETGDPSIVINRSNSGNALTRLSWEDWLPVDLVYNLSTGAQLYQICKSAETVTPDFSAYGAVAYKLKANVTIAAPTGAANGSTYTVVIQQDAVGSRVVTWDTAFVFTNTIAPGDLTANSTTTLTFTYNSSTGKFTEATRVITSPFAPARDPLAAALGLASWSGPITGISTTNALTSGVVYALGIPVVAGQTIVEAYFNIVTAGSGTAPSIFVGICDSSGKMLAQKAADAHTTFMTTGQQAVVLDAAVTFTYTGMAYVVILSNGAWGTTTLLLSRFANAGGTYKFGGPALFAAGATTGQTALPANASSIAGGLTSSNVLPLFAAVE